MQKTTSIHKKLRQPRGRDLGTNRLGHKERKWGGTVQNLLKVTGKGGVGSERLQRPSPVRKGEGEGN